MPWVCDGWTRRPHPAMWRYAVNLDSSQQTTKRPLWLRRGDSLAHGFPRQLRGIAESFDDRHLLRPRFRTRLASPHFLVGDHPLKLGWRACHVVRLDHFESTTRRSTRNKRIDQLTGCITQWIETERLEQFECFEVDRVRVRDDLQYRGRFARMLILGHTRQATSAFETPQNVGINFSDTEQRVMAWRAKNGAYAP